MFSTSASNSLFGSQPTNTALNTFTARTSFTSPNAYGSQDATLQSPLHSLSSSTPVKKPPRQFESLIPVTVKMIYDAAQTSTSHTLSFHGHNIGALTLCGWITEPPEFLPSQIQFLFCDGSGQLRVQFGKSATDSKFFSIKQKDGTIKTVEYMDILIPHKLIRISGTPVIPKKHASAPNTEEIYLEAAHFRPIQDPKEYVEFHDLEVIYAALKMIQDESSTDSVAEPTIKIPPTIVGPLQNSIYKQLMASPYGKLTHGEIMQALQSRFEEKEITIAIDQLCDLGEIYVHSDTVFLTSDI